MNPENTIADALVAFLQSAQGVQSAIHQDTDLIETGCLDSLMVMDLVCFLESRFHVQMLPQDINPQNLRSVRRLAEYINAQRSSQSEAA